MRCDAMRCDAMRCDAMRCDDDNDDDVIGSETEKSMSVSGRNEKKRELKRKASIDLNRKKVKRIKNAEILKEEVTVMRNVSKVLAKKLERKDSSRNTDPDIIFGNMIGSELKQFPEHMKFQVKHELNSVIYKYRLQNISTLMAPTQGFIHSNIPSSKVTQHIATSNRSKIYDVQPTPQHSYSTGSWIRK